MTTIRYARYVCVNREKGSVVWCESHQSALDNLAANGGQLYDTEKDNMGTIEQALLEARRKMCVE
jgi:hypothetical protein